MWAPSRKSRHASLFFSFPTGDARSQSDFEQIVHLGVPRLNPPQIQILYGSMTNPA
jgi:hypothetical protein